VARWITWVMPFSRMMRAMLSCEHDARVGTRRGSSTALLRAAAARASTHHPPGRCRARGLLMLVVSLQGAANQRPHTRHTHDTHTHLVQHVTVCKGPGVQQAPGRAHVARNDLVHTNPAVSSGPRRRHPQSRW
jgi:hypothetical protein